MGVTYVKGEVRNESGNSESVRFLVDSGATYSLIPKKVWKKLDLEIKREHPFELADGTTITRSISECIIELPQGEGHSPVILGEEGEEALLGTVTLENLGLILDPFKREIKPMRMLLA